jgi:N-methylhydantoinase A
VSVIRRGALPLDERLAGPAIVTDDESTTWLAPGWRAWRDGAGNLHLEREGRDVLD